MVQKTVQLTTKYLGMIKARGHANCYKCEKPFIIGDVTHAILRKNGHGQSHFYHKSCYEDTLH